MWLLNILNHKLSYFEPVKNLRIKQNECITLFNENAKMSNPQLHIDMQKTI